MGIPRYIPLPTPAPQQHLVPATNTVMRITHVANSSAPIHGHSPTVSASFPGYLLAAAISLALGIAIAIIIKELIGSPKEGARVRYIALASRGTRGTSLYSYDYSGLAKALRRAFDRLREVARCRWCTPLELRDFIECPEIIEFAKVYQEVVYARREVEKVDEVIEGAKKCVQKS